MEFLRLILLAATVLASFMANAQPSARDEQQRLEKLRQATTIQDAVDNMTPDELATLIGVPTSDSFTQWLQNDPELLFTPASTGIKVDIQVSIKHQQIYVTYPGAQFVAAISSGSHDYKPGKSGYRSRRGCYTPYYLTKMHYSSKYDNAPMPNSLFYYGGYAIHATGEVKKLGNPASHGCVRVSMATSQAIYEAVKYYGRKNTRVCVYWSNISEVLPQ